MSKKLQLYLACVTAAATNIGKTPDELTAAKKKIFADLELKSAQDFNVLSGVFNEAVNFVSQHAGEKMPSEIAAEEFVP